MKINGCDLGVCSWSLRPPSVKELPEIVAALGLSHAQLALAGLIKLEEKDRLELISFLRESPLHLTAGMIGFPGEDYSTISRIQQTGGFLPHETWPVRRQMTLDAAAVAEALDLNILSTHIGFVPPSNHPDYPVLVQRMTELTRALGEMDITLAMETGQERATELLQFLNDLPTKNVGANFDPANMILYGSGDPIEAVKILGRHIRHVHIKDAIHSEKPGLEWGREVPVGMGDVDFELFLLALKDIGYTSAMCIEREAGHDRTQDILAAIEHVESLALD